MAAKKKIGVFLADDHAMVREGLAALLDGEEGFAVVGQCGNGLDVVSQTLKCRPDVAVLDVTMPGLNGLDACRELAAKVPDLAILILSVHNNEQFVARALTYGASGYLLKESAADHLTRAIETVVAGQPYLGPGIPRSILQRVAHMGEDPYELLSTRERQVLQLIAEGHTNPMIAEDLGLSVKTVSTHREHLMHKLDIHDQTSLVKFAIRQGLITLE